jgi:hypothetical protein
MGLRAVHYVTDQLAQSATGCCVPFTILLDYRQQTWLVRPAFDLLKPVLGAKLALPQECSYLCFEHKDDPCRPFLQVTGCPTLLSPCQGHLPLPEMDRRTARWPFSEFTARKDAFSVARTLAWTTPPSEL